MATKNSLHIHLKEPKETKSQHIIPDSLLLIFLVYLIIVFLLYDKIKIATLTISQTASAIKLIHDRYFVFKIHITAPNER